MTRDDFRSQVSSEGTVGINLKMQINPVLVYELGLMVRLDIHVLHKGFKLL